MTTLQDRPETLVEPEPEPEVSPAVESSPLTYTARALRSGGISIVMLAALTLGFVVHLVWISGIQHHRDQATMYAGLRDKLSQGTAPVRPAAAGTPLAILEIPRLGMREVVVEGSTSTDLMHGPGHRRDTPLPGQPGVSVLYGRSLTYGGPFSRLHLLRQADVISVTTGQGVAHYGVSEVNAKAINVPAGSPTLVLVTADSRLAPGREFLVTATLISQVMPGNSTLPVISRPEIGLSGEPSALVPLMLWSQFLLIAAAFATWSYVRWSRWPTYIVTTPILLAGIWNVYENLARLLPNTL
jgi:sortase A